MTNLGRRGSLVSIALATVVAVGLGGAMYVSRPVSAYLPVPQDTGVHDPALVLDAGGEPWLVYGTGNEALGGAPRILKSGDGGATWAVKGEAWAETPAWVRRAVPGVKNIWAPAVYEHDGTWYLFYAASTFGKNRSAIGVMTATTPDPDDPAYGWTDGGEVLASTGSDPYNAIDPTVSEDAAGVPYLFFGSFWTGIYAVQLEWPTGHVAPGAAPQPVAARDSHSTAIEAPAVTYHGGYYYLFVSWDSCCQGVNSTYNIRVGRSTSVLGPYVDRDGVKMTAGGGALWLETAGFRIGPGGQSVAGDYLAFHYYHALLNGAPVLGIVQLAWADGWPVPPS
ncbi:MAG: arabinan endo-1,5-alpha-L-arabinosidase [Propionibacteriaceae bacterium]|jgi:arabinan endo-1,5-alpha-L-arabinosidase|nr:arabinan endo-1,5-alpha-L-arabinosidase [Propionibacteriaceae bacterium]